MSFLCLIVASMASNACVTWSSQDGENKVVKITHKTPMEDLVDIALKQGDGTLEQAKKILVKRGEVEACGEYLYRILGEQHSKLSSSELIHGIKLYLFTKNKNAPQLFYILSQSEKNILVQLSWNLAVFLPSSAMAKQVENVLTKAIADNSIHRLYMPRMAEAVANNKLIESYSIVRQGLFESDHVEFVRAMISLDPKKASSDFMFYLSKVPVDELRQLNLKSVNILSCMEILSHFLKYPNDVSHPKLSHLFLFSISRNVALAAQARKVLDVYIPEKNNYLALMLARLPSWIQIAFVEGSRRNMNSRLSLFLRELKKTTSQKDVIEEINNVVK